ncbi:MAG: HPr(Ser) kinase/phosphatase [Pseudomonadota bacterium]
MTSISAGSLFKRLRDRLHLRWSAGAAGQKRSLQPDDSPELRPSLAGFLNLVHPNNIQVLGAEELSYLDALDSRKRWETVAEIIGDRPVAVIVADDLMVPDDLLESAEESGTPVWTTDRQGVDVVGHIQHFLSRALARHETVHGVFMEIFSIGVLITGDSGAGKSELALELITRGHRLVADDAPIMTLIAPDVIDGTCPEVLEDCLEVRGLGILNIRAMFGDNAIKANKYLRMIAHLDLGEIMGDRARTLDRLHGDLSEREILGLRIPQITVPVAPGRNIAVLVEAAVRNHTLKLQGYDAAAEFLKRHEAHMADQQS